MTVILTVSLTRAHWQVRRFIRPGCQPAIDSARGGAESPAAVVGGAGSTGRSAALQCWSDKEIEIKKIAGLTENQLVTRGPG